MRANPPATGLLVALFFGGLLRLGRAITRWDEVALAYAAYPEPVARALAEGRLTDALGGWVGLHPPLFGLLHGLGELLFPVPALWLLGSALASLLAVAVVHRVAGPWAALALAAAPVQLAYCAEINNYPLAILLVALIIWTARGRWPALAAAVVLAGWCHLLAGLAGVAVVLARLIRPAPRGERGALIGAVLLGLLPVGLGALRHMGMESTWSQPDAGLSQWVAASLEGVGPASLGLALLGTLGLLLRPGSASFAALGAGGGLFLALLLGAAAPHQRPYLALLGPALAVGLGGLMALPRGRWRTGLCLGVGLLLLAQLGSALSSVAGPVGALWRDLHQERGVDRALARAAPGDLIWLVAPALQPDDDKSASSPVLWRFPPWAWMPIARSVPFEYLDYRYGQPRHHHGLTLHTSTELDPAVFDQVAAAALAGGGRVFMVLYEALPAEGLAQRVERVLRPYRHACEEIPFQATGDGLSFAGSDTLGPDMLCLLDAVGP